MCVVYYFILTFMSFNKNKEILNLLTSYILNAYERKAHFGALTQFTIQTEKLSKKGKEGRETCQGND